VVIAASPSALDGDLIARDRKCRMREEEQAIFRILCYIESSPSPGDLALLADTAAD
jgi:hypothetical protein